MAGTVEGGKLAAKKNLERDPNFYVRIGVMGGKSGTGHTFSHGRISPSEAGRLGGNPGRPRGKYKKRAKD